MADIGKPDSVLGKAADEGMNLIDQRLQAQGVFGGNVIVLLTDWKETEPNSNVSMLGYAGSDEDQAREMIEHLLSAAQVTAHRMGWEIAAVDLDQN
jgi:hypothetical protein